MLSKIETWKTKTWKLLSKNRNLTNRNLEIVVENRNLKNRNLKVIVENRNWKNRNLNSIELRSIFFWKLTSKKLKNENLKTENRKAESGKTKRKIQFKIHIYAQKPDFGSLQQPFCLMASSVFIRIFIAQSIFCVFLEC